ncbi:MAG: secretion protein [Acidobacteria bacterium]|nr:MAG: secretion protein [Acidobacteriota bacterium]
MKQKIYALLLTVLVTIHYGCGGTELQHGLTEDQANEVLVALQENRIDAQKVVEAGEHPTWMITVPADQAPKAWRVMQSRGLPRAAEKGLAETFGKDSLIPTAMQEKAMYLQATCNELQKTIESIDGVVQARVHIVLPEEEIIPAEIPAGTENPNRPKAAVLIKYRLNANGEVPYKEDAIKALVANSIPKLDPKDVVVVGNELVGAQLPPMSTSGGQPQVNLAQVGPIQVTQGSKSYLQMIGVGVLGFVVVLAFGLMMQVRKASSLKDENARLRASRPDKLAKVG